MKSDPHRVSTFHHDKIIVGSSLEAMIMAYKYNIPIFGKEEDACASQSAGAEPFALHYGRCGCQP